MTADRQHRPQGYQLPLPLERQLLPPPGAADPPLVRPPQVWAHLSAQQQARVQTAFLAMVREVLRATDRR